MIAPEDSRGTEISLVIVTYNSAQIIKGCLESLDAGTAGLSVAEVIIVDNASRDGTVDLVREVRPTALVVETGSNAGYAAAINAGLRRCTARDAVLILNPDTRLRPGCVVPLAEALGQPGTGIAVPRLIGDDGALNHSLRREPSLRTALGEAVLGGRRAGRYDGWGEMVTDPRRYEHRAGADWACGAVMLVSLDCFVATGNWDESFLLYSEETDFCLRAGSAGFATVFEPSSVVEHRGGEFASVPFLWGLLMANRARLYAARHGRVRATAYRVVLALGEGARVLAGQRRARAGLRALLRPSTRPTELPS
ncbi:MAG: glycosyltransferase family 2 protein [Geodermatophilaceae bacterium]